MPKKQMSQEHGVKRHFSSAHTKSDKNFIQRTEHRDLTEENSPKLQQKTVFVRK